MKKLILQESDFHYLGYYVLDYGGEFSYGQALTHRYVDGQLRFLALTHRPADNQMSYELREFAAPQLNGIANSFTGQWSDIWDGRRGNGNGRFHGLWWDDQTQRLWSTAAIDYPDDLSMNDTHAIAITALGANGTISSVRGLFGLKGVGARQIYGGFARIPSWFQSQFQVGPYAVGFGGYTSRMAQGLVCSMGPVLIAIPDLTRFADGDVISTSKFRILMDYSSGTISKPWYPASSKPVSSDRGIRTPDVINRYDNWSSPAPDGFGRWTWGDSAYQTGVWIDLPDKHGFLIIPTVHTGQTWYENSTLNYEGKTAEFQLFDPLEFGESVSGKRSAWNVKPKSLWRPRQFSAGKTGTGNNPQATACAASFDTTTSRLYVRWTFYEGNWPENKDRIHVWQVN